MDRLTEEVTERPKEKEMQALIPRKQQRDRTTSKDKTVMGRETDDE